MSKTNNTDLPQTTAIENWDNDRLPPPAKDKGSDMHMTVCVQLKMQRIMDSFTTCDLMVYWQDWNERSHVVTGESMQVAQVAVGSPGAMGDVVLDLTENPDSLEFQRGQVHGYLRVG